MGLKEYDVVDQHTGRKTTLQLSDEDAKRMGLTKTSESKSQTPANKAKSPANKQASKSTKDDA